MSRQSRLGQLEKALPCPVCANAPQPMPKVIYRWVWPGEEEPPEEPAVADRDEVITCPACGKVRVQSRPPRVIHICHELPDPQPEPTTPVKGGLS